MRVPTFPCLHQKSYLPFLDFKYHFLPCLGDKNILPEYIQVPVGILWGSTPGTTSFRADLKLIETAGKMT
jgi:hypothetical protein